MTSSSAIRSRSLRARLERRCGAALAALGFVFEKETPPPCLAPSAALRAGFFGRDKGGATLGWAVDLPTDDTSILAGPKGTCCCAPFCMIEAGSGEAGCVLAAIAKPIIAAKVAIDAMKAARCHWRSRDDRMRRWEHTNVGLRTGAASSAGSKIGGGAGRSTAGTIGR